MEIRVYRDGHSLCLIVKDKTEFEQLSIRAKQCVAMSYEYLDINQSQFLKINKRSTYLKKNNYEFWIVGADNRLTVRYGNDVLIPRKGVKNG